MAPYNWPAHDLPHSHHPHQGHHDNPFRRQPTQPYHSDDESLYPGKAPPPERPQNPASRADKRMTRPPPPPTAPFEPAPPPAPTPGPPRPPGIGAGGWFDPPKVRVRSASVAPSSSVYSVPFDWPSEPYPHDRIPYCPPYSAKEPPRSMYPTPMFPEALRSPHPSRIVETDPPESTAAGLDSIARAGMKAGVKQLQYKALEDTSFRLVRILPERMSALRCELVHASLEKPPKYIAISYAWGDSGDTQLIQIDGATVPVTTSLYGALRALRRKNVVTTVWADALCIDQDNGAERTRQVQMMRDIYHKAQAVAVWLGPEADESGLAVRLLGQIAHRGDSQSAMKDLIGSKARRREFDAVARVFEREYWRRLWVVQEVSNASSVDVYCGSTRLPWHIYATAAKVFLRHKDDLVALSQAVVAQADKAPESAAAQRPRVAYADVLVRQGPGSFPDVPSLISLGDTCLLEVLRACRTRHASVPHDKVFAVLGLLPEDVRENFKPDYAQTVKEVYTNVVDYLLTTTERLDVVCESIHFPPHPATTHNLPSWCPDWSHIPQTTSLGPSLDFKASGSTKAKWSFKDRRSKLVIEAVYLDVVKTRGVAVGTLCSVDDHLMAFLHWRAVLAGEREPGNKEDHADLREVLSRTLCAGQIPSQHKKDPRKWSRVVYQAFASMMRDRLPYVSLDRELVSYADSAPEISLAAQKRVVKETCGGRMMGRCLCVTAKDGLVGMGTGYMAPGDVIVVPLGCYSPVLLRPEGKGEYRFVGDVYMDGYMYGEAIDDLKNERRPKLEYVIR